MKKLRQEQIGGVLVLLAIATVVSLLIVFVSDGEQLDPNDEDWVPPEIDPRFFPAPNVIDAPLEKNFTNLVTGASLVLGGTYRSMCVPDFESAPLPNQDYYNDGTTLYFPCSSQGSSLYTGAALPPSFTISLWVSPENSTLHEVFLANNLRLQVSYGNASLGFLQLQEFDAGMWTFVCLTLEGNRLDLYINSNHTSTTLTALPNGILRVVGDFYNGYINQLKMWDYALPTDRVTDLYELS